MQKTITIATRKSPLALWQANHVKNRLEQAYPSLNFALLEMTTQGDKRLDVALNKVGGKGLFVKELELALYEGRADLAVHSLKDVPMDLPDGLDLACFMNREIPTDVIVCRASKRSWASFSDIPKNAHLGTSSLRRIAQIKSLRNDLKISEVRGNLGTRLKKLDSGEFDGLVLAFAGLKRLGLIERVAFEIRPDKMLPACGQGILGIEIRKDDEHVRSLVTILQDESGMRAGKCERALNRRLNGGCQVPIAAFAVEKYEDLWLRALVGSPDCGTLLTAEGTGPLSDPEGLGIAVAEQLILKGAREFLIGYDS